MWQLGWMFSLIPDTIFVWITYILMAVGAGLYIASKLIRWIPLMGQYKLPAELIGVVALVFGSYLFGSYGTEMVWRERVKAVEEKVAEAEKKADEATARVEIQVVEKVKVVEKRVEVVRNQIIKDKEIINADCKINDTAISDYNKAIADPEEKK
jgi:predicted membrane protein